MSQQKVHIVGGGVIGICTAWYLAKEGVPSVILDKGDFTDGTSYGNAGMIVPSHFIPMTTPGAISQGLKWMLNSKSPFYIKPRLNFDLMQWLWHFFRSAHPRQVKAAMPILYALNLQSKHLYKAMAAEQDFSFEEPKTKAFLNVLQNLKVADQKTLLVTGDYDQIVHLSSRNLAKAKVTAAKDINVYDVLNAKTIILSENSVEKIKETFA